MRSPGKALFTLLLALATASLSMSLAADNNPALWKHQVTGDFFFFFAHLKSGLETGQFLISGEEDLAAGLENNKHLFAGEEWNKIGFKEVRAVHFCSIMFNQEVFNINMEWSVLCPFKVVAYNMQKNPKQVTILMVKPSYMLEKDKTKQAREIGKKIDERIFKAITSGVRMEIP